MATVTTAVNHPLTCGVTIATNEPSRRSSFRTEAYRKCVRFEIFKSVSMFGHPGVKLGGRRKLGVVEFLAF